MTLSADLAGQATRNGDLFSIAGKVALVTGSTGGIGLMIARRFVAAGATVYVHGRDPKICADVAARLSEHGRCIPLVADLSSDGGIREIVDALNGRERALHILVNNAGLTLSGPVDSYAMSDWDAVFAINVRAPFALSSRLLPLLTAEASRDDPGRIINIGSLSGNLVTNSNSAFAYGPSKAALHHLSRALAVELAPRHVTVNAIAPGGFPSKMMDFEIDGVHAFDLTAAQTPTGRMGTEEDIGGLAIYLASRAGAYMTGAVIPLDGAWSVKGI